MENGKMLAAAVAIACVATAGCNTLQGCKGGPAHTDPSIAAVRRPAMMPMYKGQAACKKDMQKDS